MGKKPVDGCVATRETTSQTGAFPDFRPLRPATTSGVPSRRYHGGECGKNLPGQTSCGGARENRHQRTKGEGGLKTRSTGLLLILLVIWDSFAKLLPVT